MVLVLMMGFVYLLFLCDVAPICMLCLFFFFLAVNCDSDQLAYLRELRIHVDKLP
jgi:hypothetical protein